MEQDSGDMCTKVTDGRAFVLRTGNRNGAASRKVKRDSKPACDSWQPDSATLQKASAYRLFSTVHSVIVTKNAASRMRQKVISRKQGRRRGRKSDAGSDVTSTTSLADDVAQRLELDLENLDKEHVDEEEPIVKKAVSSNQKLYCHACRKVGVTPATTFYKNVDQSAISLRHHVIGPDGAQACAITLMNNTTVQTLDLGDNDLRDEGCGYICQMLAENIAITDLTLSDNSIGSEALADLVDVVIQNDRLCRLDLSGNNFNEHDAVHIARLLKESQSVEELILIHNCFREEGGAVIAAALGDNDILESLDLSWNHLRRRGAVEICKSLKSNLGLTSLRLAWNGLSLEGCKALGASLPSNAVLKLLDLSCNRIDFAALTLLLQGVQKNTSLQRLKLTNNPLGTEGANAILSAILKNENSAIEELDIADQCVDQHFIDLKRALIEARRLVIHHGIILSQDTLSGDSDDAFSKDDPMMVLMEFMRLENLRLVDLFATLDKDGSKTLTRDEFKNGLLSVSIPLSPAALDRLINKLDADGDGEVDFGELIAGQREHKKKLNRLKQKQIDIPFEDTELGKLSTKLKAIMLLRRGMRKPPSHNTTSGRTATFEGTTLAPPKDNNPSRKGSIALSSVVNVKKP